MRGAGNSWGGQVGATEPRTCRRRSGSRTMTRGSEVSRKRMALRQQGQLRRARSEAPAPLGDESELLHDLVLQVPRQDHDDVRPLLADLLGGAERDVAARQEVALLVRVQVAGVVDEVRADAAVVEKRVALRRRAVANYAQGLLLEVDQEVEDLALVLLDAAAVAEIGVELLESGGALSPAQLACRLGLGLLAVFGMGAVDPQRAAVGGQLLDVVELQPVGLEDAADGQEGE